MLHGPTTHQCSPEVPLPGGVVDAGEELVEVGAFLQRLLPERVRAADVPSRDDLEERLVLHPPVLLENEESRGRAAGPLVMQRHWPLASTSLTRVDFTSL